MEINFSSYIELLTYPIRLENLSSVRTLFSEMLILLNSSYRFEQRIKTIVVFDCTNCILLKGIWQRGGFSEVFLQKSVRHRFLTLKFEPFRFGLRIRGDIRNRKKTPRLADSESRGVVDSPNRVVFRLRISPRIRSPKRNGSKGIVRDLWGPNFCKNPRKSASLPCPFKTHIYTEKISCVHSLCISL